MHKKNPPFTDDALKQGALNIHMLRLGCLAAPIKISGYAPDPGQDSKILEQERSRSLKKWLRHLCSAAVKRKVALIWLLSC